ncbi:FRG domain-containing protein [Janthinobacterium lividum]|uniref:FRG domain-containing protein n=1 Tax=Janthinobacterium lividum TaxID=29581 RepID=A0ABU0XZQ8_9BURK|nr:FRG domain-containing protein [Janthinobacterium lividum]MDQ4627791.1 FRG domain-containing protein [Janthinobacterium lividum]MDQ4676609.1 FRG domain-containing protein [Janthinobacterium lividum]MDQ4686919.1 FRG domain-containing protein [Janthinobacterium lividum]
MPTYEYPEHTVDSVWSALDLAEKLKASGDYDLFRGQRHTFPIQPSIFRTDVDKQDAERKLNSFASWVHGTPDLSSLHRNENALLAVAQHYGIKTPLMDFTSSPRIAAFFATDGGNNGDTGTIICLNRARFTASWADLNNRYAKEHGARLTELIDIDVRNLWRLQAQFGVFLRCHVEPNLLEMFSHFLHIRFPQSAGTQIEPRESIYPSSKSHLEVLLEQYFLIDSYPDRDRQLEQLFGHVISVSEDSMTNEIKKFFKTGNMPTPDGSWSTEFANSWMQEPDERYHGHGPVAKVQLRWPTARTYQEFEAVVAQQIESTFGLTLEQNIKPRLTWSVVNERNEELYVDQEGVTIDKNGEFTNFSVAAMLDAIYSGMRYLPYTTSQIQRSIIRYLAMLQFGVYEVIQGCKGVEFSGASVRSRGFASRDNILASLRDNFFDFLDPAKLDSNGKLSTSDIMFAASQLRGGYNFERFLKMFVEDLIPSQAVIAVEGLVIGVNPMRIDVFGES